MEECRPSAGTWRPPAAGPDDVRLIRHRKCLGLHCKTFLRNERQRTCGALAAWVHIVKHAGQGNVRIVPRGVVYVLTVVIDRNRTEIFLVHDRAARLTVAQCVGAGDGDFVQRRPPERKNVVHINASSRPFAFTCRTKKSPLAFHSGS